MAATWIDIVDSAVKIGLGGVIGGVATLLSGWQKSKHEISVALSAASRDREKELRANRRRLVESVSVPTDNFFRAHSHMLSWAESASVSAKEAAEKGSLTKEEKGLLHNLFAEKCEGEYLQAYQAARLQIAVLKLASARESANLLVEVVRSSIKYRDEIAGIGTSDEIPDLLAVRNAIKSFSEKVAEFEDGLSKCYEEL